jgi:hypothetical protein
MSDVEFVEGWGRIEVEPVAGALTYEATFVRDGVTRSIKVDRFLVDRWGQDWRRREELRLLREPNAKPESYSGQYLPRGDSQA